MPFRKLHCQASQSRIASLVHVCVIYHFKYCWKGGWFAGGAVLLFGYLGVVQIVNHLHHISYSGPVFLCWSDWAEQILHEVSHPYNSSKCHTETEPHSKTMEAITQLIKCWSRVCWICFLNVIHPYCHMFLSSDFTSRHISLDVCIKRMRWDRRFRLFFLTKCSNEKCNMFTCIW